jgi:exopolysaccharide biosynthesis protein
MWHIALAAAYLAATAVAAPTQRVSYASRSVAGTRAHVLTVRLGPEVRLTVAVATPGFPHANEEFTHILSRTHPTAAINGAFFSKSNLAPIGDIYVDGHLLRQGLMGTALAIRADGTAQIRRVTWGHAEDWSAYETVLACGPTLVRAGVLDLTPGAEGFRDPHVLGAGSRSACGLTRDGKLILVSITSSITLTRLAQVMLALGCTDAMSLDGGASVAMYYRGKVIASPGRRLTNVLLIYEDRARAPAPSWPRPKQQPPLPDAAPDESAAQE